MWSTIPGVIKPANCNMGISKDDMYMQSSILSQKKKNKQKRYGKMRGSHQQ